MRVKALLLRHKKLHIWLLAVLAVLGGSYLVRGNRAWMNAFADHFVTPLHQALGGLCYRVSFSVMEVIYVLAALFALYYAAASVIGIVRAKGRRWDRAYGAALGAVCGLLTVYTLFWLLWGVYFWTDSFQDKSGVRAEPVAVEDLRTVTAYFAQNLAQAAENVPRDQYGLFAVSREEILSKSSGVYRGAEALFPFLEFQDRGVKPMTFSRLMSRMDFTGFYCAYTGESNVNVDSPACFLPSTIAHELGHQRGFASEQECNFLAVLAATTSGEPAYEYSGWLLGYIYLGNALYAADQEAYWSVRDALPETVLADLQYNNAYWAQFRDTAVQKVSTTVYDGLLKGYGEERGIQSYGTVVDMLVAYYK